MASTIPTNGPRAVPPPERAGGHPSPAGGRAGRHRIAPPVLAGPLIGGALAWLGTVSPAAAGVIGGGMATVVVVDGVRRARAGR